MKTGIAFGKKNPKFQDYTDSEVAQAYGWIQGQVQSKLAAGEDITDIIEKYGTAFKELGDEINARETMFTRNRPTQWMEDFTAK